MAERATRARGALGRRHPRPYGRYVMRAIVVIYLVGTHSGKVGDLFTARSSALAHAFRERFPR